MCQLHFITYSSCGHFYLSPTSIQCTQASWMAPERDPDPRVPTPAQLRGYCYYDENRETAYRLEPHRECPICLLASGALNNLANPDRPDPSRFPVGTTIGATELDNLNLRRDIPMNVRKEELARTWVRHRFHPDSSNPSYRIWFDTQAAMMEKFGFTQQLEGTLEKMSELENIKRRQDLPLFYRQQLIRRSYTMNDIWENLESQQDVSEQDKATSWEGYITAHTKHMEDNWEAIQFQSPIQDILAMHNVRDGILQYIFANQSVSWEQVGGWEIGNSNNQ